MNDWMNKQRKKWIKKKEWVNNQNVNEWTNAQTNDKNNRNNHWFGGGGGGGANFPTSDDLQIFFGALYHEMVRTSPEHKGSDHFLPWTPVLFDRWQTLQSASHFLDPVSFVSDNWQVKTEERNQDDPSHRITISHKNPDV